LCKHRDNDFGKFCDSRRVIQLEWTGHHRVNNDSDTDGQCQRSLYRYRHHLRRWMYEYGYGFG